MSAPIIIPDAATERRVLARGQPVFRQGDRATAIFFVEKGRLRLERRTFDGRLVTLHTARAGELFAEASLFAERYHCDAVAIEPSEVHVLPKDVVLNAIHSDPKSATSILAVIARQLQDVRQRLELRNVRSARERVMLYLEIKADPEGVVALRGELQDIAADLGLTREALYRTLATLEQEGTIKRDGPSVKLKKRLGA